MLSLSYQNINYAMCQFYQAQLCQFQLCARPILDIAGEACCQVILTSINGTVQSIVVIGIALADTYCSLQYKMKFSFAVTMSMAV